MSQTTTPYVPPAFIASMIAEIMSNQTLIFDFNFVLSQLLIQINSITTQPETTPPTYVPPATIASMQAEIMQIQNLMVQFSFVISQLLIQIETINTTQTQSPTPPPQAVSAGFTNLVFSDDFTSAASIAPSGSPTSGYNWYWATFTGTTSANFSVGPTATAAQVANGNTGGAGPNASPLGGILTVNGPTGGGNSTLLTVPGNVSSVPSFGSWKWGYFEAYIQFNVNASTSGGWPAFWCWSVQALSDYGFGGSAPEGGIGGKWAEVDFMESYDSNFSDRIGLWSAGGHDWGSNAGGSGGGNSGTSTDSNWHTYGCLWVSTGSGTGHISFYLDNVLQVLTPNGGSPLTNPMPTGTGTTGFANLELGVDQFVILGTGLGEPMNVDWVRIWQA